MMTVYGGFGVSGLTSDQILSKSRLRCCIIVAFSFCAMPLPICTLARASFRKLE